MQRELYRQPSSAFKEDGLAPTRNWSRGSRTDPKHRSHNPTRRTKRAPVPVPAKAIKRDRTFINISEEMKHGRGPRR